MKYTKDFKLRVVRDSFEGMKNQDIADKYGIHERTIRTWKSQLFPAEDKAGKPRILLWDIENSEIISAHYGLWGINVRPDRILHPVFLFSAAWKWYGHDDIYSVSLLDDMKRFKKNSFDIRNLHFDDYVIIKALHTVLSQADVIVHHNGDKHDLKKFNARCLYHGLPPINPDIIKVDTCKLAKKHFGIESNSLNYLCTYLGIPNKISNRKGLFSDCLMLDKQALKDCVEYNKGDISPTLEMLFERLSPYITSVNTNLFNNGYHCPNPTCGSPDIELAGYKYNKATRVRQLKCNSCGKTSLTRKSDRTAEVRP